MILGNVRWNGISVTDLPSTTLKPQIGADGKILILLQFSTVLYLLWSWRP